MCSESDMVNEMENSMKLCNGTVIMFCIIEYVLIAVGGCTKIDQYLWIDLGPLKT